METSSVVKYLEAYPMNAFSGYLYCSDLMDIKAQPWLVSKMVGTLDSIEPECLPRSFIRV